MIINFENPTWELPNHEKRGFASVVKSFQLNMAADPIDFLNFGPVIPQ